MIDLAPRTNKSSPYMSHPLPRALAVLSALALVGVVLYFGIVFDAPLPDHPWLRGKNDWVLHALAFFVLTLPVLALCPRRVSVVGLTGLAGLVEIAQFWLPRRNPGLGDVLASGVGIALGAGFVWGLHRYLERRAARQQMQEDEPVSKADGS